MKDNLSYRCSYLKGKSTSLGLEYADLAIIVTSCFLSWPFYHKGMFLNVKPWVLNSL